MQLDHVTSNDYTQLLITLAFSNEGNEVGPIIFMYARQLYCDSSGPVNIIIDFVIENLVIIT